MDSNIEDLTDLTDHADAWYSLDGRKLNGNWRWCEDKLIKKTGRGKKAKYKKV